MIEDKELLERAMRRFSPEPGVVERVMRRRDRKRRNRRIGSSLLALIIAVAALGGLFAAFRQGERHVPAAPPITPTNVSDLRLLGSVPFGGSFAVSDGLVYMGNVGNHELEAFPASCFGVEDPCGPTWVAHLQSDPRMLAAADGYVYVATDAIYAYAATCATGGVTCQPTWVGAVPRGCAGCWGAITLGANAVYVPGPGRLYAYPLSCTDRCQPAWVAKLPGHGANVVASSGIVVVESGRGLFIAFQAHCASDGSVCQPSGTWKPPGGGSLAAIPRGEILLSRGGETWAYPASCALGRHCQPLWGVPADGQVVVAGKEVFISTGDGVKAFPVGCGTPCQPLWWASVHPAAIVATDGLLFSYQGVTCTRCLHTRGIFAFPTMCGIGDAECEPAWVWRTTGGTYVDQLVVTDGRIYAATDPKARGWSNGSDLSVFGIDPGSGAQAGEGVEGASSTRTMVWFIIVTVIAILLAVLVVARRRRTVRLV